MTGNPNASSRDAALRRLTRVNRWLIAASVTLTGVLTEVAAQAFPGKTIGAATKLGKEIAAVMQVSVP